MPDQISLDKRLKNIRAVVLDVDGVLTNGQLIYDSSGNEYKSFSVLDGLGIKKLMAIGIQVAIVTGRESNIVARRAKELGIEHVYQDVSAKDEVLNALVGTLGIPSVETLYIGDDEPDMPAMRIVGVAVAVANAVDAVKTIADYVTEKPGGEGAVREVCERLLAARL